MCRHSIPTLRSLFPVSVYSSRRLVRLVWCTFEFYGWWFRLAEFTAFQFRHLGLLPADVALGSVMGFGVLSFGGNGAVLGFTSSLVHVFHLPLTVFDGER